jgi:hypothetical protein
MAQRKKQRAARSKARKRTAAKKTAKPARQPAAKARPKRAAPKKAARLKVRQVSSQTTVAAEIQTVDAFEEPVAEVEERGADATPEPPDEKPS